MGLKLYQSVLAILLISVAIYFLLSSKEKFYSEYSLSASDVNDKTECQQCITQHQNDKGNLCTCLKNNSCDADVANYCNGVVDKISDCDNCSLAYGKCMSTGDFKSCRSDLCDCLTKFKCDQKLTDETCQSLPDPSSNNATGCLPSDGVWSKDGVLQSPCCQPSYYQIYDKSYPTCKNFSGADSNVKSCLENCCKAATDNRGSFMDPSFTAAALCGCSLCCNNRGANHFKKYASCESYIYADKADVLTPDDNEVGDSPGGWRGFVGYMN